MEISPQRLLAICGALFAGVVAINFAEQYRSNAQFKEKLTTSFDLGALRSRLQREEGLTSDAPEMEQPSVWPTANLEDVAEEA